MDRGSPVRGVVVTLWEIRWKVWEIHTKFVYCYRWGFA
jgi:hypothetical protein